jgi:acyl-CoA thioesterase-1
MRINFNAFKLYLLLIVVAFFGCKKNVFEGQNLQLDSATTPATIPAAVLPEIKWYNDTTSVVLPISDGLPINPAYKKGNETATIVILGSSTAEGKGASQKKYSWVELLTAQLKKDKKVVKVVNLGKANFTTYHIMPTGNKVANRPTPDVLRNVTKALSYKPFLVIVNLPTNDIDKKYTDTEILANFTKFRKAFEKAKVDFIVTGTQPRNFTDSLQRQRLNTLNTKIVNGAPVRVANVLNKLSNQDYSIKKYFAFTDGIHPNDLGHRAINGYIFNTVLFKQLLGYKAVNPLILLK